MVPSLHALREHVTRRIDALEVLHANRLDRLERFLERLAEEHRLLQRRLDTLERELLPRCVRRIEELIGGSRSE
ncbi:MAG: hypothetical protein ACKV0T_16325 [Planctomycetales bacterium]